MDEPILVIEDDPSINSLLHEALTGAGYRPGKRVFRQRGDDVVGSRVMEVRDP